MKYDLLLMDLVLYVCCTVAEHQQNVFVKVSSFTKSHQPVEVVRMPGKTGEHFKPGDLVFAKMKGFPPWPARVTTQTPRNTYNWLCTSVF